MAIVAARETYLETGMEILADLGFGGLKLAEVCRRVGVTTGSFYHYFDNWSAYTNELIRYWAGATRERVQVLRTEPDPRKRIDATIEVGLALPHAADAAIRAWSSMDPQVREAQTEIDRLRFEVVRDAAQEILGDERQAQLFASGAVYMLVGYEQCTLPADAEGLSLIAGALVAALDFGHFSTAPPE